MTKEGPATESQKNLAGRTLDRLTGVLRKRPWVLPAALAVFAIATSILLPGYIASRPAFLERYEVFDKHYSSWRKSTHAEIACQSCHVPPGQVDQALFNMRMLAEFYLSAAMPARTPKLFGKPGNASCETCHYTSRTVSPSGDLKIPHRAHVGVLKLKCVHCHKWVVHFKNPEGKHTPRMKTCLVCHNGTKAKKKCATCHKRKSFPLSHRSPEWLVVHPDRQKQVNCRRCHGWTATWCRQCHSQRPNSHKGRWRTTHRFKVRDHRNCEACHKGPFCVRCHGEVPKLNIGRAPKYVP